MVKKQLSAPYWSKIAMKTRKMTQRDKIFLFIGSCLPDNMKNYHVKISQQATERIMELI